MALTLKGAKDKTKNLYNKAKERTSSYSKDMQKAYNIGFNAGYNAYPHVPKRLGSYKMATNGFHRALKTSNKISKHVKERR